MIRGEKIKVTKAIQEYIETKLARLDKYFKEPTVDANVLIKLKGKKQAIEVTIPYDKYTLRSEEERDDLYAAIDIVIDKLERQIRKTKTKLKKQTKKNDNFFNFDYELTKEEEKEPLSVLVDKINQRYKTNFTNMDKVMEQITQDFLDDEEMVNLAKHNDPESFRKIYNDEFQRKAFKRYQQNTDMFEKMMSEPGYMEDFMTSMFKFIYDKLKNKGV